MRPIGVYRTHPNGAALRAARYRLIVSVWACAALMCFAGCGTLGPPLVARDDNVEGVAACLDLWSLVHFSSGTVLADFFDEDSFGPTLGLVTAYEVTEPHFWPGWNESELNQNCDIAVGMFGWLAYELAKE